MEVSPVAPFCVFFLLASTSSTTNGNSQSATNITDLTMADGWKNDFCMILFVVKKMEFNSDIMLFNFTNCFMT